MSICDYRSTSRGKSLKSSGELYQECFLQWVMNSNTLLLVQISSIKTNLSVYSYNVLLRCIVMYIYTCSYNKSDNGCHSCTMSNQFKGKNPAKMLSKEIISYVKIRKENYTRAGLYYRQYRECISFSGIVYCVENCLIVYD